MIKKALTAHIERKLRSHDSEIFGISYVQTFPLFFVKMDKLGERN